MSVIEKNKPETYTQGVHFARDKESGFHDTLKKRVNVYFLENNVSKNANGFMVFKIIFFLGLTISMYTVLVFGHVTSFFLANLLWIGLGFFAAFSAVNICHDAIHGALTKNKVWTTIFSYLFNVLGANAYMWHIMHNVVHHTYTNISGHDEDIEILPILRLSPSAKLYGIHKYQHLYAFPLYGLSSLLWVLVKDYVKFFKPQIGSYETKKHPKREMFNLFFFKGVYYTLFIVLPFVLIPLPWWQILTGFLLMHLFEGLTLAIIFMLAHVVEDAEFPQPNAKGNMNDIWAVHQLKTTTDFCAKNPVASFFCGGLNLQIEHHLFSNICHVHYQRISPIVKQTALEFNVPYMENPTFFKALRAHYNFLKKMGNRAV